MDTNFNDQEEEDIRRITEWANILELNRKTDVESRWEQVERKIHALRFRQKVFSLVRNAAAALLLPALITAFLFHKQSFYEEQQPAQIEMLSAYGQVSKISLPDGSEVWLNSGSKLIYPHYFTGDHRKVQLTGEAYFKVQADRKRRFDVQLPNGLTAAAYGTEFNINAYEDDREIEIVLASGKLEIASFGKEQTCDLQPSQQAVFNKEAKTLLASGANIYLKTAWKDGKIVFRRSSMGEIINRLSKHFNVDIELQGKELHSYEYSATFTTESIADILRLLEKSAPIRCRIIEPKQNNDFSFTKRKVIIQTINQREK
jgi:ferric-dicitrate binding protein FerR (iron transport regulator)